MLDLAQAVREVGDTGVVADGRPQAIGKLGRVHEAGHGHALVDLGQADVDLAGVVALNDHGVRARADHALAADRLDGVDVRRLQLERRLDWAGLLDLAAAAVLSEHPARVVVDVPEGGLVGGLEAIQRLEDGGLSGLVLADQAGHVARHGDGSGVEDVAETLDSNADQLH